VREEKKIKTIENYEAQDSRTDTFHEGVRKGGIQVVHACQSGARVRAT